MKVFNKYFSQLYLGENGIWYNRNRTATSYPSEGSDFCYSIEDESFWFQHRNNCIISILNRFLKRNKSILFDIGGGNGYVSKAIQNEGYITVLVEPSEQATKNAINRGIKYIACTTIDDIDTTDRYLPNVGLFDVIEHIKEDKDFLCKISEMMEDNGLLFITVPAYDQLWSHEDVIAGHYRRYNRKKIESLLIQSGYHIEYFSYFFEFLPIPIFLFRTVPSFLNKNNITYDDKKSRDQHSPRFLFLSRFLNFILDREVS
ncbi:methyltransferase domain-containing protein, partial [Vibrio cholerae]|nr:methyltransferase domain-containing protein [Vibrio cholerae]